jgi:chorismate dehydratase
MSYTPSTLPTVRCGKIGYLNILPIYYPLESGAIPNDFRIASGSPARLNELMATGVLDASSVSCIEYARRPEQYRLVPNLGIGSRGPVQSVLLLSKIPIEQLAGGSVLVTSQTHTSAALLKLLFKLYAPLDIRLEPGRPMEAIRNGALPTAVLAIGDDALRLRRHRGYPHVWDLGEVWREWTGLPFIFGVWVVSRAFSHARPEAARHVCETFAAAKAWGLAHLDAIVGLAASNCFLSVEELTNYFNGLVYDLGVEEQAGLRRFFECLVEIGEIDTAPELDFFA